MFHSLLEKIVLGSSFPGFIPCSQYMFCSLFPSFLNNVFFASLVSPLLVVLTSTLAHGFVKRTKIYTAFPYSLCGYLGIFLIFYHFKCGDNILNFGDVHPNPGPPSDSLFKFMHWNLNSMKAHNFERCNNLTAYNSEHNFHLIAITETALSNSIPDDKINIDGYIPIRCDLPGNDTHGGVLIYHRSDISVKNRLDLCDLSNTIVLELSISRKILFLSYLTGNTAKPPVNLKHILQSLASC